MADQAPARVEEVPFDVKALDAYLNTRIPNWGQTSSAERLTGGQSNPTYRITAGGRRYVLRKQPPGVLLPSAHAVDREYQVMTALQPTRVPVPRTHCFCDDPAIVGTPFYIMDFVEGRSLPNPLLPGMQPGERAAIWDELNRVIAELHTVDYEAVGLGQYGRPGNYFNRQVSRWSKQYRASETERIDAMEHLIEWLPAHIPARDEVSLVHGDYRIDNLLFHGAEPKALALLDWELSTLGHPLADFAYHMMTWRLRSDQFRGIAGNDLEALGIPSEDAYLRAYCRRTRREVPGRVEWEFCMAFGMFRLAAILQGILKRAQEGNAASDDAVQTGMRARAIAETAWRGIESLG